MKAKIVEKVKILLMDRLEFLNNEIEDLQNIKNEDTKSTAGDKFETNRAMLQNQLNLKRKQLQQSKLQFTAFLKINFNAKVDKIIVGSLVTTNNAKYLLGIGLGKIQVENTTVLAVSLASPFGKMLLNKQLNNKFIFNGKQIEILEID